MRQHKFKVWDKQTEKMYKVVSIDFLMGHIIATESVVTEHIIELPYDSSEFTVLLEFNGLHDKNGEEIYEGDIIGNEHVIGYVKFKDGSFQWIYPSNQGTNALNQDRTSRLEKKGNIFENPELVKSNL